MKPSNECGKYELVFRSLIADFGILANMSTVWDLFYNTWGDICQITVVFFLGHEPEKVSVCSIQSWYYSCQNDVVLYRPLPRELIDKAVLT